MVGYPERDDGVGWTWGDVESIDRQMEMLEDRRADGEDRGWITEELRRCALRRADLIRALHRWGEVTP